jgi:hypothetical protein
MKIGNILLAIFLWFLAFISILIGTIIEALPIPIGDTSTLDFVCMLGAPLIFFILGIIVLLLGLRKTPSPQPSVVIQQPSQKEVSHTDRRCPSCGRTIPFYANVCPYCGRKFVEFQRDAIQDKCHYCRFDIQSGDIFCEHCGKKIKE